MAGTSTAFANALLNLILNGTAISHVADNASSSPLTNLYASLHTADPGPSEDQTNSEATYTGYARVAVPRSTGWSVSGGVASPASDIVFPTGTGGFDDILFFAIGTASTGTGRVLWSGSLTEIFTGSATAPVIRAATTITES